MKTTSINRYFLNIHRICLLCQLILISLTIKNVDCIKENSHDFEFGKDVQSRNKENNEYLNWVSNDWAITKYNSRASKEGRPEKEMRGWNQRNRKKRKKSLIRSNKNKSNITVWDQAKGFDKFVSMLEKPPAVKDNATDNNKNDDKDASAKIQFQDLLKDWQDPPGHGGDEEVSKYLHLSERQLPGLLAFNPLEGSGAIDSTTSLPKGPEYMNVSVCLTGLCGAYFQTVGTWYITAILYRHYWLMGMVLQRHAELNKADVYIDRSKMYLECWHNQGDFVSLHDSFISFTFTITFENGLDFEHEDIRRKIETSLSYLNSDPYMRTIVPGIYLRGNYHRCSHSYTKRNIGNKLPYLNCADYINEDQNNPTFPIDGNICHLS